MTKPYGYIQIDSSEMEAVSFIRPKAYQIADYFMSIDDTEHQGRMINECGDCMKTYPCRRLVTNSRALPCRHRHCPICRHWKSERWQDQAKQFLSRVASAGNTAYWLVLTLSGQRSFVSCLSPRVDHMENAFRRITGQRFAQHILGCIRFLEVDEATDDDRIAMPSFRCLLLVTQSFHNGPDFIPRDDWAEMWRHHLHMRDTSEVDLKGVEGYSEAASTSVLSEISKSINCPDRLPSKWWFLEMAKQLYGAPEIDVSGVLWPWLREQLENQASDLFRERRYSIPVPTSPAYSGLAK